MSGPASGDARLRHLRVVSQSCIHCGLCLEECPTYLELGNEMDSPRGRILLMRSLAEGDLTDSPTLRRHLDLCLGCRACEAICPSGVRYGELLEDSRALLRQPAAPTNPQQRRTPSDRILDYVIYHVTPRPARLRLALRLGRWGRRLGVNALLLRRLPRLGRLFGLLNEEPLHAPRIRTLEQPRGAARAAAAYFTGCATSVFTPRTVERGVRLLTHNGCAVECPRRQVCCGAIHAHGGRLEEARRLARHNIEVFQAPGGAADAPPLVTVAAGCGAMLRSYGQLLSKDAVYAERARLLASRVRDITEVLVELGPRRFERTLTRRVTYHDACHHVHVQGVRGQPRALLEMIPGVELVEAREAQLCCGAAGSYNITQPETAGRLGARKLANLSASGAAVAVTGNIGCILHLNALREVAQSGGPATPPVVHTVDLLHEAYGLRDE